MSEDEELEEVACRDCKWRELIPSRGQRRSEERTTSARFGLGLVVCNILNH